MANINTQTPAYQARLESIRASRAGGRYGTPEQPKPPTVARQATVQEGQDDYVELGDKSFVKKKEFESLPGPVQEAGKKSGYQAMESAYTTHQRRQYALTGPAWKDTGPVSGDDAYRLSFRPPVNWEQYLILRDWERELKAEGRIDTADYKAVSAKITRVGEIFSNMIGNQFTSTSAQAFQNWLTSGEWRAPMSQSDFAKMVKQEGWPAVIARLELKDPKALVETSKAIDQPLTLEAAKSMIEAKRYDYSNLTKSEQRELSDLIEEYGSLEAAIEAIEKHNEEVGKTPRKVYTTEEGKPLSRAQEREVAILAEEYGGVERGQQLEKEHEERQDQFRAAEEADRKAVLASLFKYVVPPKADDPPDATTYDLSAALKDGVPDKVLVAAFGREVVEEATGRKQIAEEARRDLEKEFLSLDKRDQSLFIGTALVGIPKRGYTIQEIASISERDPEFLRDAMRGLRNSDWKKLSDNEREYVLAYYASFQPSNVLGRPLTKGQSLELQQNIEGAKTFGKLTVGMVPIAGTVILWNEMDNTWRGISIATDILAVAAVTRPITMLKAASSIPKLAKVEAMLEEGVRASRATLKNISPTLVTPFNKFVSAQKEYATALTRVEETSRALSKLAKGSEVFPEVERAVSEARAATPSARARLEQAAKAFGKAQQKVITARYDSPALVEAVTRDLAKDSVSQVEFVVKQSFQPSKKAAQLSRELAGLQRQLQVTNDIAAHKVGNLDQVTARWKAASRPTTGKLAQAVKDAKLGADNWVRWKGDLVVKVGDKQSELFLAKTTSVRKWATRYSEIGDELAAAKRSGRPVNVKRIANLEKERAALAVKIDKAIKSFEVEAGGELRRSRGRTILDLAPSTRPSRVGPKPKSYTGGVVRRSSSSEVPYQVALRGTWEALGGGLQKYTEGGVRAIPLPDRLGDRVVIVDPHLTVTTRTAPARPNKIEPTTEPNRWPQVPGWPITWPVPFTFPDKPLPYTTGVEVVPYLKPGVAEVISTGLSPYQGTDKERAVQQYVKQQIQRGVKPKTALKQANRLYPLPAAGTATKMATATQTKTSLQNATEVKTETRTQTKTKVETDTRPQVRQILKTTIRTRGRDGRSKKTARDEVKRDSTGKIVAVPKGSVTWRQGKLAKPVVKVLVPPYRQQDLLTTSEIPQGAKDITGAKQAFRSVRVTGGSIPKQTVKVTMGNQEISVIPEGKRSVKLDFNRRDKPPRRGREVDLGAGVVRDNRGQHVRLE